MTRRNALPVSVLALAVGAAVLCLAASPGRATTDSCDEAQTVADYLTYDHTVNPFFEFHSGVRSGTTSASLSESVSFDFAGNTQVIDYASHATAPTPGSPLGGIGASHERFSEGPGGVDTGAHPDVTYSSGAFSTFCLKVNSDTLPPGTPVIVSFDWSLDFQILAALSSDQTGLFGWNVRFEISGVESGGTDAFAEDGVYTLVSHKASTGSSPVSAFAGGAGLMTSDACGNVNSIAIDTQTTLDCSASDQLDLSLEVGSRYVVDVLLLADSGMEGADGVANTGIDGLLASNTLSYGFESQDPQANVEVLPEPDPSSVLLLAAGLLGLRERSRAVRRPAPRLGRLTDSK